MTDETKDGLLAVSVCALAVATIVYALRHWF